MPHLRDLGIRAVGVDPTTALLDIARTRDPGGDYRLGRAEALDEFSDPFDLVVSYLSLIDIPDLATGLQQMVAALRPGGILLIANLNSFNTWPGTSDQTWTSLSRSSIGMESVLFTSGVFRRHVEQPVRFCHAGRHSQGGALDMSKGVNAAPWISRWPSGTGRACGCSVCRGLAPARPSTGPGSTGLPAAVEICAVQLPGREQRIAEPAFTSIASLIGPVTRALGPYLDLPFAFFGHSMGATIAYDMVRRIQSERGLRPCRLLVSASAAPHLPRARPPIHHLPDARFIEELRHLNGTPDDVLANAELMGLMMPLLRADFQLAETYDHVTAPRLDCRVAAYGGADDGETSRAALAAWSQVTFAGEAVEPTMVQGDHFYINTHRPALLAEIGRELLGS